MNPWRLTGACLALTASVLVALSLVFPLLAFKVMAPPMIIESFTITAWGYEPGSPTTPPGPVNAVPLLFGALLLLVGVVLAFVAAGNSAAPARRRAAKVGLTVAAAFTVGVAMTVVPQVASWMAMFGRTFQDGPQWVIGMGLWTLAAGAVFAVVAAVLVAEPDRKPEAAPAPAPSAGVAPTSAV